ncbi:hypothetical protein QJS04_geneDACA014619 [Acorus gramineus]|uniref:Transposase MuDR plant domain-containing protein n=1 Tax=Acorus gramineus TaxID=55184 RepID=A0AAV9ARI3_ACOGR|nr:hypothetical protein QJS04_geneDACA014619 [Acorus gramineus]
MPLIITWTGYNSGALYKRYLNLYCPLLGLGGGDFNEVRYSNEKVGGRPANARRNRKFNECISKALLRDLKATRHTFSWSNRQDDHNMSRLGRILSPLKSSGDSGFLEHIYTKLLKHSSFSNLFMFESTTLSQFTKSLDEDKIAMIDLWEDIGPWANSTKSRLVRFTYVLPNSLPREYIEVDNYAKLLQIFKENKKSKKFTLYVIANEEEIRPSTATHTYVGPSGLASHDDGDDEDVREVHVQRACPVQTPVQHVSPDQLINQHESVVETPAQHIQHVSNVLHHIQHMEVDETLVQPPFQLGLDVNEEVEMSDDLHEEELHWDAEDIDIEDEEKHSMNSESDESVEGKEVRGVELQGDFGGSGSEEVCSDKFENEFVEIDDERPRMKVGSKFPNVNHFRNALKQHCVINEFAVLYEKNEKHRVTARCKKNDCTWRIHASVLRDGITFEIRTLREEHTCTSVNKVGNEIATSSWLANKFAPILQKAPELGPSKLKAQIQQKYNITLPYCRV